uniref:Membrane transporter protein n=1 Tax=Erythrolobus madagascarensis TaxID=708628 RepID=A0A7S0T614_9RHOD|mmetsp:Transcript_1872/g.4097  ORF Transcript_1872/g.4097 Transcript_1872/m.4097 type:complete len:473 (+) Transcript_1872:206-1624(+)
MEGGRGRSCVGFCGGLLGDGRLVKSRAAVRNGNVVRCALVENGREGSSRMERNNHGRSSVSSSGRPRSRHWFDLRARFMASAAAIGSGPTEVVERAESVEQAEGSNSNSNQNKSSKAARHHHHHVHISSLSSLDQAFDDFALEEQMYDEYRKQNGARTDVFKELFDFVHHADRRTATISAASISTALVAVSILLRHHSIDVPAVIESVPVVEPESLSLWQQVLLQLHGPRFTVALAMGISAFTQALTGFGFAIVSVGLLSQFSWITNSSVFHDIQPIAAAFGLFVGASLVLPEANEVNWKQIAPLSAASVVAAPLGAHLLSSVDEALALKLLGGLIIGFVVFLTSGLRPPKWFADTPGALFWGSLAGVFGGAFDIQGPPLVFFGQATSWTPAQFRRNILSVVAINSAAVLVMDWFTGRLDSYYVFDFIQYSAPAVVLGLLAGKTAGSRIDPKLFKNVVLVMCALMGSRLLFS